MSEAPLCENCSLPKTWWRNTDKYHYWICHPCKHKRHPAKESTVRTHHLKKKGVTVEWYDEMLAKQDGKCAICNQVPSDQRNGKIKKLNIDHDHKCCTDGCSKCIRGLLCTRCNLALGKFDDDIIIMSNAITYLKKYVEDIPENG